MKKNILLAILFIALAASFYGYKLYHKEHKNLNEIKPDYIVSPANLLAEFEVDETAAQTKYVNKIIQIEGKLLDIQKVGEQVIWIISTSSPLSNIQCEMDPRYIHQVNKNVVKGTKVIVQGICSGKLMDIILNQVVYKS